MSTTTRGVGVAKRAVAAFLQAQLPAHLAALRTEWGVDIADLPDFIDHHHNQPLALDQYPVLAISATGLTAMDHVEYQPGNNGITELRFWSRYDLRVFTWVKEEGWDRVIDVRDDLTAAVRTLLVDRPTLGSATETYLVNLDTIAEEYSEVQKVKGERYVAGSIIGFELRVAEAVGRTASGTVQTVRVDESALQPQGVTNGVLHPALM